MTLNNLISEGSYLPDTIAEAVDRLLMVLSDEQKLVIAVMDEEDLIDLHFGLGTSIRNAFRLHDPESKLLASCGTVHPDDASGVIIKELWNQLKHGN
jgi:Domain of unknown function (DUF6794)